MQRWTWLALASITYLLAFWFPEWLWWLVFFYPVGIIVAGVTQGIPWYMAYLWGYTTYTLHGFGLYYALIYMADGPVVPRLIPSLIISLYIAVFPALIFGITTWLQQSTSNRLARTGMWLGALIVLTYILDSSILAVLGVWEGYPFFHPIVPLASMPSALSLLPLIDKLGYTICIYLVSTTIAYAIISPRKHHLMWILISLFPWIIAVTTHVQCREEAPQTAISRCTVIPLLFPRTMALNKILAYMRSTIQEAQQAHPQTTTWILPESAFHRSDIHANAQQLPTANTDQRMIYGAFSWIDTCYYNTLSVVDGSTLTHQFRKRHALPLSERIPSLLDVSWIRNQYCAEEPDITASNQARNPIPLVENIFCVPYICSELFMHNQPDDTYPEHPIIFVGNDVWLRHTVSTYIADLMLNYARVQAMRWVRPIWYITYKHAYYISRCGELTELQVHAG